MEPMGRSHAPFDDETVVMDDSDAASATHGRRSMAGKSRSMSDGGGTPSKLSPSPHIVEATGKTAKDDSAITTLSQQPVTPRRPPFGRGLALQMHLSPHPFTPPVPSSPKLDPSQTFASPTLLPRRSRGLDFSRAATSLHHSILAEQPSPGSSPVVGSWATNVPPGGGGEYGGAEQSSSSLWSMMGNQERMNMGHSLGSHHGQGSDLSSSSDDDVMDEDMDESFVTTPQVAKMSKPGQGLAGGTPGSPAMGGLSSFQQRQRPRKQPRRKARGHIGLGFGLGAAAVSKSPSNGSAAAAAAAKARRESISWQANQLHISSGGETDESGRPLSDADGTVEPSSVVRRVVTRRGNLLPKPKNFARIRAALAEECAPGEADFMREAEIVKQVRESDVSLEPRHANATPSSDAMDEMAEEPMGDPAWGASSRQPTKKPPAGSKAWDAFSESSSMSGARTPPPPPPRAFPGRGSSSSGTNEDVAMGSPVPSAADMTRRINNKRRRDEDLNPSSFKRRAVSPSMSAHGSPVVQSPLQRDSVSWGSRPGSTGASGPSESGSAGGTPAFPPLGSTGQVRKGRVGLQGMVDTNDGIMRMSIE